MKKIAVIVVALLTSSAAFAAQKGDAGITFKNCKAAFAAGYHDMKRGEPGYAPKLDRNHDGVACETDNRWVEKREDGKYHKVDDED